MSRFAHRLVPWSALVLALVLNPGAAGAPFISPEFGMDAPILGAAWSTQLSPGVAFNGTHYLAVWADYRGLEEGDGADVYGARITTNGIVLDPYGFIICSGSYGFEGPVVAASGENFLVAWRDNRIGVSQGYSIFAATVTGAGTVRETNGVFVASASSSPANLAVAGNGTDFLLIWNAYSPLGNYDIYGARISGNGVNPGLASFPISSQPGWEQWPAVASRGSDYVVVWQDNRNATVDGDDIYGTRVSAAGDVLDPDGFAVSRGPWVKRSPAIAASGATFLVAWQDTRNGGADIYAARLSANGEVMDTNGFAIAASPALEHVPRVVANANNYLVLWSAGDDLFLHDDIYGATVSSVGSPTVSEPIYVGFSYYGYPNYFGAASTPQETLVVWPGGVDYDILGARVTSTGDVRDQPPLLIATGANAEQAPAIAFNGNTYLVVWQDSRSGDDDIYGVRVAVDGSVLDHTAIPISTSIGSQFSPAVASLNGQFLVVWSDTRNGLADIYGARVRDDGFVMDANGFAITTNTNIQRAVAVAANDSHYLVVWRDSGPCFNCNSDDIHGTRVTGSGTVLDSDGFPIVQASGGQEAPAVASNGDEFLVVWRDDRRGRFEPDIYGALVRNGAVIAADLPISTAAGQQRGPEVASDGVDFLVVWRTLRDWNANDFDIYGARVSHLGSVLDTNGFAIGSGLPLQVEAAVAFGGTNYLVTWQDFRNPANRNDIYGARVSLAGAVLDESGFVINPGGLDEDIMGVASAGSDNFLVVGEGLRSGGPRVVANVVAYGELPPPPPDSEFDVHALNNWQTQFSLPPTNELSAIAYGNGRFVAGGTLGRIAVSTNVADWTVRFEFPGFGGVVEEIVYRDGFFVGVGYNPGMILRSTTGTGWQVQPVSTLYGVEYANGRYLAVGAFGNYFTSTNYTNWTSNVTGTSMNLFDVAYGNGLFVAVGAGGAIRVSTNGLNWTSGVSLTNSIGVLFGITYAQGQFVAVGYYPPVPQSDRGAIITSPDGTNWTVRACPATNWLRAVTYAERDHLFLAVGHRGTVLSSRDAENWTTHPSGVTNDLFAVTYGDGVVVVVGSSGKILVSDPLRYSAPRIVRQPAPDTNVFVGANVTFNTAAIGTSPRQFQWFKDNQPIPGATGDTLSLSNLQEADSGNYTVAVGNAFGSDVSQPAAIKASFRVGIVQPPLSQSIVAGGTLVASVLVTGTPPFSFEWRRGPNVLASNVSSAPLNFVTLSNVQLGGFHQVRVRNPAPFLGVAGNFDITVLADTDGDGLPDEWEAAYNFDTNNPANANADPDLDGFPNSAEYEAGTDPTDPTSYLKLDGIRVSGPNSVLVDFQAISNRTYTLLSRPELHVGPWNSVTDIVAHSANQAITITNPLAPTPATRFYRLVTPRAP